MPDDLKIESANDFKELTDEQMETIIGRPGAAAATKRGQEEEAELAEHGVILEPKKGKEGQTPAEEAADTEKDVSARSTAKEALETAEKEVEEEATPVVEAERKLATEFGVFDKEGELEIPDLTIKFKANGQEREAPLDKIVRWAQIGVSRDEREPELLGLRQQTAELRQQAEEYYAAIQQYESYLPHLFENPDFYEHARTAWAEQNSPAMRAARAERELGEQREQLRLQHEDQQIAGFVNTTLTPKIEQFTKENPSVSFEEIMGRFSILTAPYLVRGRIPLQALPQVDHLVSTELADWVLHQQETRSMETQKQDAKVTAAKTQTTLAKRQVARRTAPPGESAPAQPKKKSFDTAKSWLDATLPVAQEED
jgi:hypothetical protein